MATVHIALGSNLGDRHRSLLAAWEMAAGFCGERRLSRVYETEPMHVADQPRFLNAVGEARTSLAPLELLDALLAIETSLGRDRKGESRMGPRLIDLDILLYDDLVLASPRLCIPHPRMADRRFVLVPLLELAPALLDPRTGRPWAERLPVLAGQGVYSYPSQ
ncbi:MAG: 2-amino-4-hydroxy-6-hydroxymethyldihydropteridine diphosphokinase [Spirochaetes bacterium]|nr:2-amino-4-hydroxy-6-hydroxymethyldihydropteridine diphosphokinase [Spirochaetota bacterium]